MMLKNKRNLLSLIGCLGVALLTPPVQAAEQAWIKRSNENAKLLFDVVARYAPESASGLGLEEYDEQITDLSHDWFAPQSLDTGTVMRELERRHRREAAPKVRQDLEILIGAAICLNIKSHGKNCLSV